MKRFRILLVAVTAVLPTVLVASPASASCQTNPDIGDWCKVRDAVYDFGCDRKVGWYLGWCG